MEDIKRSLERELAALNTAKENVWEILAKLAEKHSYDLASEAFKADLGYLGLTKAEFIEYYQPPIAYRTRRTKHLAEVTGDDIPPGLDA